MYYSFQNAALLAWVWNTEEFSPVRAAKHVLEQTQNWDKISKTQRQSLTFATE